MRFFVMCSNAQKKSETLLVVDLITTHEDRKFASAGQMATAIIEVMEKQGFCLPQDLNEKDFAPEEVAQHWHMAYSLATVEMKLMCESETNLKSIIRRI